VEDAMAQLGDQVQTRLALASLFGALVQTLDEQFPTFALKFDKNLERIFHRLKEYEHKPDKTIETLRWTSEIARGRV
jgi:hypothetical protein